MSDIFFEKLSRGHNRKKFDCGEQNLNKYLQRYARQNAEKNLSETYVLTDESKNILGFYTINTVSLDYDAYPLRGDLPKYAIPSALIGRLAVDKNHQGNGYGKILLVDALNRIVEISDEIGIHCITVDAKDENAKGFYKSFGFKELLDEKKYLYISIEKVQNSRA
jgi:ribosomal protein S18 acetylase RimI-like enzyme